jgi:hypothetical protein
MTWATQQNRDMHSVSEQVFPEEHLPWFDIGD